MALLNTILIISGVLIVAIIVLYNKFINLRNAVKNSWAGIDVQLKRRADLIPNLVDVVKGYATHEKMLLINITKMRSQMLSGLNSRNLSKTGSADGALTGLLKKLIMVAENYPNLKANKSFIDLQKQLRDTEDQIAASRRIYNENVTYYNTALQVFPNNIFANLFGFKKESVFESNVEDRKNINIKL